MCACVRACVQPAALSVRIDGGWQSKHGLLSVIYLLALLARRCRLRLLIAAAGANGVHTRLDPYCAAARQVKHTRINSGAAEGESRLVLIVFLRELVVLRGGAVELLLAHSLYLLVGGGMKRGKGGDAAALL